MTKKKKIEKKYIFSYIAINMAADTIRNFYISQFSHSRSALYLYIQPCYHESFWKASHSNAITGRKPMFTMST